MKKSELRQLIKEELKEAEFYDLPKDEYGEPRKWRGIRKKKYEDIKNMIAYLDVWKKNKHITPTISNQIDLLIGSLTDIIQK